jgi:toxin-antitoxin system PIN domain toxin
LKGRVALLDVNVLLALFNPDHVHHEPAHDWFADNVAQGWATCPLTENAFLRIVGTPTRERGVVLIPDVCGYLRQFCASGHHEFWGDAVSIRDDSVFDVALVRGHRQLTDVYLLGLAVKRAGRLVTFDRSISLGAVKGATRASLEVISPAA